MIAKGAASKQRCGHDAALGWKAAELEYSVLVFVPAVTRHAPDS
jgi:hypothetical protein